jgi:lactate permease
VGIVRLGGGLSGRFYRCFLYRGRLFGIFAALLSRKNPYTSRLTSPEHILRRAFCMFAVGMGLASIFGGRNKSSCPVSMKGRGFSMFLQTYTPVPSIIGSFLLAALPLAVLFLFLATGWLRPYATYVMTWVLTAVLANQLWHMPFGMIASTLLYGVLFALFPLFYMIWSSLFLFRIAERCGSIVSIQNALKTVEGGMEWKILLIGFGLTAFIDSTAGFLAPIVIGTALLTQLGVDKERSAVAALTSCAVPAVFGAVGVPTLLLAQVSGHPLPEILRSCVYYDGLPAVLSPFLTCWAACGWTSVKRYWFPCLTGGMVYAVSTLLSVLYLSPSLGGIIGAACYLIVILMMAKRRGAFQETGSAASFFKLWWPFFLLTWGVMIWSLPGVQTVLHQMGADWSIPLLDRQIQTQSPFGTAVLPAIWKGRVVASAGTAILVASYLTAITSGMKGKEWVKMMFSSLSSMRLVAFNLCMICSVGFLLVYSGMAGTLAYPFRHAAASVLLIAPLMGWLGTFLTGSNAASIALFGGMQSFAAQMAHLPPAGIAACFAVAAVGGKMVAPQALEVAVQASHLEPGSEAKLFRKMIGISVSLPLMAALLAGLWKLVGMTSFP